MSDSGTVANLSLELLRCGVSTVIGMSYKLLARAAGIFTQHFYESLLVKGADILTSTWEARRALREDRSRQAFFGLNIDVDDSIVPVFYTRHVLVQSPSSDFGLNLGGLPKVPMECWKDAKNSGDIQSSNFVGREFDMLCLENSLIANNGFLYLFGHIGVGKTALLDDAISWWRTTKYIRSSVAVDISEFLDRPLPTVLDRLKSKVKELSDIDQHSSQYPSQPMVEKRSIISGSMNNNTLIIIDQAEDYLRVLDNDQQSSFMETLSQFHCDINQQHPTLMIIASCCKMKSLFSTKSIIFTGLFSKINLLQIL